MEEVKFGPRLEKKEDVELMLRRAQAAVLSPTRDISRFAQMDEEELRGLVSSKLNAFSKNVICIDLAGPDLVDLSFIDLPGKSYTCSERYSMLLTEIPGRNHSER